MLEKIIMNPRLMRLFMLLMIAIQVSLSFINELVSLIFYTGLIIFLLDNGNGIIKTLKFKHNGGDLGIFMIVYYLFIVFLSISIWISINILFNFIDFEINSFWIIVLYLIIYLNWITRFEDKIFISDDLVVLKFQTVNKLNRLLIPKREFTIISLFLPVLIFPFVFFNSLKTEIDILSAMVFTSFVLLMNIYLHLVIHFTLTEQLNWNVPEEGKIEFDTSIIEVTESDIPDPKDSIGLGIYFKNIFLKPIPPSNLESYLKNNLAVLIPRVSEMEYYKMISYFIYAMNNWGGSAINLISYYNLIILASFSKFRNFGLMKLRRRKQFFRYLMALLKMGMLPGTWLNLIEFELKAKNTYARDIFNIIQYNEMKHKVPKNWIDIYHGFTYKGKDGYKKLASELWLVEPELNEDLSEWDSDVWILCSEIINQYIGSSSKTILSNTGDMGGKLLHLSKGNLLATYMSYKERREIYQLPKEKTITHPIKPLVNPRLSNEEKKRIIMDQIGLTRSEKKKKEKEKAKGIIRRIIDDLKLINYKSKLKYILIYCVNILFLLLLDYFLGNSVAIAIVLIEVIILILLGGDSDKDKSNIIRGSETRKDEFQQKTIEYKGNLVPSVYGIFLTIFSIIYFAEII